MTYCQKEAQVSGAYNISFNWPFMVVAFLKGKEIVYLTVRIFWYCRNVLRQKKSLKDSYAQRQDLKSTFVSVADQSVLLETFQ